MIKLYSPDKMVGIYREEFSYQYFVIRKAWRL